MSFLITTIVQGLFFRGMKIDPKNSWVKKASSLGEFVRFNITRNGKRLSFYKITPHKETRKETSLSDTIVILSHPISRKAKYFFSEGNRAKFYLERGCSVVAFDYNGFGESNRIDLFYWKDVGAIIQFIKTRFSDKKIILHGTSFGAFHIIRATIELPLASKVILENVNKSLLGYWGRWPLMKVMVNFLVFLKVKAIQDMNVEDFMKSLQRDDLIFLFLACEEDNLTPAHEVRDLFSSLNVSNKQFYLFPKIGHLEAPIAYPELYQKYLFSEVN